MKRGSSNRSHATNCSDDVEMGEGDAEDGAEDDGSDNDSVTSDSQRPSKKKKGQRFFCTDFPPCQLSFTRSEHLARHIRFVMSITSAVTIYANLFQKTYRRTTFPVSLLPQIFSSGQPSPTCANCACQRRHTWRLACGYQHQIPTSNSNRPGTPTRKCPPTLKYDDQPRWSQ